MDTLTLTLEYDSDQTKPEDLRLILDRALSEFSIRRQLYSDEALKWTWDPAPTSLRFHCEC